MSFKMDQNESESLLNNIDSLIEDKEPRKSGCYVRSKDNVSQMVPLKHIDYCLDIVNSLLNVTLTQTYFNPLDKFLEVDYSFPLHPQSSLYKFSAQFGDVTIQGIIKEKEQARTEYFEAMKQGKQVVIAELNPQSLDIMNLQIGNVPPKANFVVKVSFLQQMSICQSTFYRLHIPSTISPRCTRQASESSFAKKSKCISKPFMEKSAPSNFTWSFKINLKTTQKLVFFQSSSHQIQLVDQNFMGTETNLAMKKEEIPNRDFSFLFTTENFHIPNYVVGKNDKSATIMLSFIPKFCQLNINQAYKAAAREQALQSPINTTKGDYIFLVDRSGSMEGNKIETVKQSLIIFLKSLPEDSFFNVISFGSTSEKFFRKSVRNTNDKIKVAIQEIKNMKANFGGTQIYRPLKNLLEEKAHQGYPKHIFLLTDGGVGNTEEIIKMIRKNSKFCRVHCIGIGNGASFSLIHGCAKEGKGKYAMVSEGQNPAQKIIEILNGCLTPIIQKISLDYNTQKVQSIVPNPKSLPYILKDETTNFFITYQKPFTEKERFTFEYFDSVNKLPYKIDIEVDPNCENFEFIDKMAHLKVIKLLQNMAEEQIENNNGQNMLYTNVEDYKKEAIEYSIKHQVLSKFTSFLCIGKGLDDSQFEMFKQKGSGSVHIDQILPYQYTNQLYYERGNIQLSESRYHHQKKGCGGGGGGGRRKEKKARIIQESQSISSYHSPSFAYEQPYLNMIKQEKFENSLIQSIIQDQNVDGSWSNQKIIPQICQKLDEKQVQKLYQQFSQEVVITYLITLWFQKNYDEKKYSMIMKKASNWLLNNLRENAVGIKGQQLRKRMILAAGL